MEQEQQQNPASGGENAVSPFGAGASVPTQQVSGTGVPGAHAYAPAQPAPQQTASYASQRYAELYARPVQPAAPVRNDSPLANMFGWLAASVVPALVVVASEFGSVLVLGVLFAIFGFALPIDLIDADTTESLLMVGMQMSAVVFLLPWWDYIYQRSFLRVRRAEVPRRSRPAKIAQRVVGVILIGLALQVVVSALVSFALEFFPTVSQEYSDLMEEPAGGVALAISVLSATVGAPLMEELAVRALVFEFTLRAFNFDRRAQWRFPRTGSSFSAGKKVRECDLNAYAKSARATDTMLPASFWLANIVQAFIFAVLHMNITQGVYTFFMGLIFGWVAWRSGKLRYSILLHFTLNASSYLLDALPIYDDLAYVLFTLVMVLVAIVGYALFESGCTEDGEADGPTLASELAARYAAAPANAAPASVSVAEPAAAAVAVPVAYAAETAPAVPAASAGPAPSAAPDADAATASASPAPMAAPSASAPTGAAAPSSACPDQNDGSGTL